MAWIRQVCGRIKSDFRYSNELVNNNFSFPKNVSDKQKNEISEKANQILKVRELYKDCSINVIFFQFFFFFLF